MSVYLTTAQLELVKKAYSGGDKKDGFEENERRRRELSQLVKASSITPLAYPSGLKPYSMIASIPDLLYIIYEEAKLSSTDTCINNTIVGVVPVTHDEYRLGDENPFRKDSKRRVLRLDFNNRNTVELLCPVTISKYNVRYVSIPNPIILSDLTAISPQLTINGLSAPQPCLLNEGMHREILNRAVDLAILSYRENTLANNIQSRLGLDYKED